MAVQAWWRRGGDDGDGRAEHAHTLAWHLTTALAALASAVTGMALTIGLTTVGWVQVPDVSFWGNISTGLRLWLLGHGAGAQLGSVTVTVIPLGLTLLLALAASGAAGVAARHVLGGLSARAGQAERRALTLRVAGVFTAVYLACVMFPSFLVNTPSQSGHALLGGLAVGLGSSLVAVGRTLDWNPVGAWPAWARAIPRAVAAGCLLLVVTGAVVLATALLMHQSRVMSLHDALAPGRAGGVVLVLAQLLWVPNMVLWCASWALGAGFSIGIDTVISPAQNLTGLLPSLPAFGAVPANGPVPKVALLWLLSGVVAGVVAAVVIGRSRRLARADETSLVGGLSGVLTGLVVWLLCALSNGDLGTARLIAVGARLPELAVMAPTVMGLSGMAAGLVLGLLNPPPVNEESASSSEDVEVDWPDVAPTPDE